MKYILLGMMALAGTTAMAGNGAAFLYKHNSQGQMAWKESVWSGVSDERAYWACLTKAKAKNLKIQKEGQSSDAAGYVCIPRDSMPTPGHNYYGGIKYDDSFHKR